MEEKDAQMSIHDELSVVIALLKTANMAVGNAEYFGNDGQSIAVMLDIVSAKLEGCRKLLAFLDKGQKNV